MKFLLIVVALFTVNLSSTGFSQITEAEKVYSIVKVCHPYDWYETQYDLWQNKLSKNKKNAEAWENLYTAARMAKIMAPSDSLRNNWNANMETAITGMSKAIPNTYEYYHLKSWHSSIWGATKTEVDEIISWGEKAYSIDPKRTEIYPDLMNACMILGQDKRMEEFSKVWLESGDLSPNLLALNYNMLMSTVENAIILTAGDNDTYPAIALQQGKGIRKDVTLINIFCGWGSENYLNRQLQKCGIPFPEKPIESEMDIINHILSHAGEKAVYFSYGDYLNNDESLKGKMYNVGLAIRYAEGDFNNTSVLLHNFEQNFLLDHLKFNLYDEQFPEQVKRHNLSYLPGLMMLYKHYKITENLTKQNETKQLIQQLVSHTEHEETVNAALNAN